MKTKEMTICTHFLFAYSPATLQWYDDFYLILTVHDGFRTTRKFKYPPYIKGGMHMCTVHYTCDGVNIWASPT